MTCRRIILEKLAVLLSATLIMLLISCGGNNLEGMLIFTQVPADEISTYDNSRLVAIDPEDPEKLPEILTGGFHSACSPNPGRDTGPPPVFI
jgi:hypothetical protein